jgi:hypothetical protein
VIDDVIEGVENTISQLALPYELPDVFLAVKAGVCDGNGRSELLLDAEVFGATPSGLIEDENGVHVGATLVAISSR